MPNYTNEEIEKREAAGVKMKRLNCGWGMPRETMAAIAIRVSKFVPRTEEERRNKRIWEYAFLHNMNAQQIIRLHDPLIVCLGNRNLGKPLSGSSIGKICKMFAPEIEEHRQAMRDKRTEEQKQRADLFNRRAKEGIKRPQVCAACGGEENIEIHHIIPLKAGGTNDYFNLVGLCHDCHLKLHRSIYRRISWKEEECHE